MGVLPDTVGNARPAMLELVNACRALPNFDTLQIVHFSLSTPPPTRECWPWQCGGLASYTEGQKQALREQIQRVKDLAIDCLKEPEKGCQEGGRKKTALRERMRGVKDRMVACPKPTMGRKTTLRVIELSSVLTDTPRRPKYGASPIFHLGSVKVEEYEV